MEEFEKSMAEESEIRRGNGEKSAENIEGPEEGEILEESDETVSSMEKPSKSLTAKHPLEHSWTFWFDSPSARSKQVAWGASMRPIYTFSSVEEFWG